MGLSIYTHSLRGPSLAPWWVDPVDFSITGSSGGLGKLNNVSRVAARKQKSCIRTTRCVSDEQQGSQPPRHQPRKLDLLEIWVPEPPNCGSAFCSFCLKGKCHLSLSSPMAQAHCQPGVTEPCGCEQQGQPPKGLPT